ncbi:MAG: hypothetical protein E6Q50_09420 [Lysobacter sp.]|nr:MAG: hypothetical protein E6Q50_09420 [Lysobacter sp.]
MSRIADADILGEVVRMIEQTLKIPADKVDIDANFETFGINSLIVMELMENIEKEFDVTLTPTQFSNVDTVRGLAGLLENLTQEAKPAQAVPAAPAVAAAPAALAQSAVAPSGPAQPLFFATTTTPSVPPADPYRHVLDYIRGKYALDLPMRGYGSVDEIVNTLISDHADALFRHYGITVAQHAPQAARAPAVAIVGISCRLPDAPDHHAFWANLVAGKASMREIPKARWDADRHYADKIQPGKTVSKWGALIDDVDCFDAGFFSIPAEEAANMDPQQRLLLQESYRAVEDAGIDMKSLAGTRTGVFVGYEYSEYEQYLRRLNNQDFTKGPLFSSSSPSYYLSSRISYVFDLCGPSESYNVNCASSAVAINRAFYSLLNGESDIALTAAVSLNLFEGDYVASSQYGVLSPDGSSGVFDDDANGFTRGEGVAALVLKRLSDAERDNDRIYAVIRSCHQNYRGAARNISEIKHESIARVLGECYQKAGVPLESVRYIEVDGYATKWADSFEYEGVKGAFAKSAAAGKHVALGSLKGNIGNVESVSGIANVIKIALSMRHGLFPATISKNKVNTFIDIDNPSHTLYIADRQVRFDDIRDETGGPIRAGVNSFADSGSNVHILLEEYLPSHEAAADAPAAKRLFVLSAKNAERLQEHVRRYVEFLSNEETAPSFEEIVFTSQCGREAMNERLAIVAASKKELLEKLKTVEKTGIREKLGLESRDIHHARINPADKHSVAAMITPEMVQTQLVQSAQSGNWRQIAMLWANGVVVPWASLWRGADVRKASLPAYPFARERYWVDIEFSEDADRAVAVAKIDAPSDKRADAADAKTPVETALDAESTADGQWHFYLPSDSETVVADAERLRPAEKIALFLRQEAAKRLGATADAVALDRDFIELGLDSMGIADLIIKTDALLETNLSPSVLFKNPDIGSLSEHLGEQFAELLDEMVVSRTAPAPEAVRARRDGEVVAIPREVAPEDVVVPLQTKGGSPPVFALPGAGGSALSLQQLSRALGDKQPFYCLEAVGLDGTSAAHGSVREIVDFNLRALRTVQARGPYRLLGYSNGGVIAYEMARTLVDDLGERASLVLLDTISPLLPGKDPVQEVAEVFSHFVSTLGGDLALDPEKLRAVPERERAEYLHGIIVRLGFDVPKKQFVAIFDAAAASERACVDYVPPKMRGALEVTLFRATRGYPDAPVDYGWQALVGDRQLRVHSLDADHFSLIESDGAAEIARKLTGNGKPHKKTGAKRETAGIA